MTSAELALEAKKIRKIILKIISKTNSSHIGSCFSIVDILTVLYKNILSISSPEDLNRDIFILSKGHAVAALYATLSVNGFISQELLDTYALDGSRLAGHVIKGTAPGIEATSGSLGHGLSLIAGFALANKMNKRNFYCLLGDGECNEGSVWEAASFCSHFKLGKITAIIDCNKQQGLGYTADIMDMSNMAERWQAFGWETMEVDGHSYDALQEVLTYSHSERNSSKPLVIIAHTIKGKGVSWMEDKIEWHYKSPTEEQLQSAIIEIDSNI
ncbi:MAG: transketolase [Candidatus Magasanikbacteria bacterium]